MQTVGIKKNGIAKTLGNKYSVPSIVLGNKITPSVLRSSVSSNQGDISNNSNNQYMVTGLAKTREIKSKSSLEK